jgi:glycosyltransferase involved in cell wall biosynthesis
VRILLDYRPALRERTGVGEFVHELARALVTTPGVAGGDHVAVLTTSWKDRPGADLPSQLPGVSIVDRRVPVRPLTWAWNRLGWPPVEWLAGPADVVHSPTPLLIPTVRAAQVIMVHDLDFLSHPDRSEGEMRRDFPALIHKHARRADHIIVPSKYTAGEVQRRLDVAPGRITVCSPGAPEWAAAIAREHTSGRVGSAILFVGTLEARKNIAGLLDAYTRLRVCRPDAPPLVLAGRVTNSGRAALARVKAKPLGAAVTMLGYVDEDVRRQLYRDARMLVLPSLEEGFGLPVLEAMACGVPVVVSRRGALPEVAGAAAYPVDPEDTEAIADEMERLLDAEAARDAASQGLTQAARYTWSACARAAREAYRAAVAVHAGRHG